MRPRRWKEEHPIPSVEDFILDGVWPVSAVCMRFLDGHWVRLIDTALPEYDGVLFLKSYEWVRSSFGSSYTQTIKIVMSPPSENGSAGSLTEVSIDLPYGESYFRDPSGGFGPARFGPTPYLTGGSPGSYSYNFYRAVEERVTSPTGDLFDESVPVTSESGLSLSARVGMGKVLLRPGATPATVLNEEIAGGMGYRRSHVGGRTMIRGAGKSLSPSWLTSHVIYIFYVVQTGAGAGEGWGYSGSLGAYPISSTKTFTKVAMVQVAQMKDGSWKAVNGGLIQVARELRRSYYSADDDYLGTHRTPAVDTSGRASNKPLIDVEATLISGSNDYDTWPYVAIGSGMSLVTNRASATAPGPANFSDSFVQNRAEPV